VRARGGVVERGGGLLAQARAAAQRVQRLARAADLDLTDQITSL